MGKLIAIRHGQSTWNADNRFTGWVDIDLSEKGVQEAEKSGKLLKDLSPLSKGWDGTYNGLTLPQDDYWFHVYFENGKSYSGHFSLLRQ